MMFNQSELYNNIINKFIIFNPNPPLELNFSTDFQLLIAVILSAQCTDKRVNIITKDLFKAFPDAHSMSNTTENIIFSYIKSISYPHNKAKYIFNTSKIITEKFNSQIPKNLKILQTLPGVGRKTANVIGYTLYDLPVLAVDTHVYRTSKRLGLVNEHITTPLSIEKQLVQNIPKQYIGKMSRWLILHGRYTCKARKPKCTICILKEDCRSNNKFLNVL